MSKTFCRDAGSTSVTRPFGLGGTGLVRCSGCKKRRQWIDNLWASAHWPWYLDKTLMKINGETHCLSRAVDHEGGVLEAGVTKRRDSKAALGLMKKLMKRFGVVEEIVTDRLPSFGAALNKLGPRKLQLTGRWLNNCFENSHLAMRRRERAMLRSRRMRSLQNFASVHASISNHFNLERHLGSRRNFKRNRDAALCEWRRLSAA